MSDDVYKLKEDEQENYNDDNGHDHSYDGGMIAGVVFIMAGIGFLLGRSFGVGFDNWWALFILIPAFTSFGRAWQGYQHKGQLDQGSSGALMGGMFMLLIASIFLFGLSWSLLWPVVLIMIGVGALLQSRVR